jgi:hypothetical protein
MADVITKDVLTLDEIKTVIGQEKKAMVIYDVSTGAPNGLDVETLIRMDASIAAEATARATADNAVDVYNVTARVPLGSGYYTLATAIAAVPVAFRKLGLKLTYASQANVWVETTYIGSSVDNWTTQSNWSVGVTTTELGYLSGVTSNLQEQLNNTKGVQMISHNSAAPTPNIIQGTTKTYEFSSRGLCTWITDGATIVEKGDKVNVARTGLSTWTWTHMPIISEIIHGISNNPVLNKLIKELYAPNVLLADLSNPLNVNIYKAVLISDKYYSGIKIYKPGGDIILDMQQNFTTEAAAENVLAPFYQYNGAYALIDWSSIPDNTVISSGDNYINSEIRSIDYSPSIIGIIANLSDTLNLGYNYKTLGTSFWNGSVGSIISRNITTGDRCSLNIYPVIVGQKIHIETYLNTSAVPAYFIVNSKMTILSKGALGENESSLKKYDLTITDETAAYICVNAMTSQMFTFVMIDTTTHLYQLISNNTLYIDKTISRFFPNPKYFGILKEKCPSTFAHIKNKDKDVTVVFTGTSLTQGNLYTTERIDAKERAPLMHSNDLVSSIYDKLINLWDGQKYRRYDHEDIVYSASNWVISNLLHKIKVTAIASVNGILKISLASFYNADAVVTTDMSISQICEAIKTAINGIANSTGLTAQFDGIDTIFVTAKTPANVSLLSTINSNGTGVTTSIDNELWDDRSERKNPICKSTIGASASLQTTIPSDAWRFNFMYKTDAFGGNCTIFIAEGNGKVEVYNGATWVEANGYIFSTSESAATATKGNTCYQKRLNMRCKNKATSFSSIGETKLITITKADDNTRLSVVGFEWSPREFMLIVINGARGSHQWGINQWNNLERYQDSDIWEFAPDLIMSEVTIKNWGGERPKYDPTYFVNIAKSTYFNENDDNPASMYVKSNGYTTCEIIFYGSFLGGGITENGLNITYDANHNVMFDAVSQNIVSGSGNEGKIKNAFENYDAVDSYMESKDKIYIPCNREFKRVAELAYFNYWSSFQQSFANGSTLSFDGTHLNNKGASLWTNIISPIFDI